MVYINQVTITKTITELVFFGSTRESEILSGAKSWLSKASHERYRERRGAKNDLANGQAKAYCFHSKGWQVILGSTSLSISLCKTRRQIALIFHIQPSYLCYSIFCSVIDIYIGRDISLGLHNVLLIGCCGNRIWKMTVMRMLGYDASTGICS